ncbi:MAG: hypothetical protein ACRYF3_16715 [Janthinobacterium lividum]
MRGTGWVFAVVVVLASVLVAPAWADSCRAPSVAGSLAAGEVVIVAHQAGGGADRGDVVVDYSLGAATPGRVRFDSRSSSWEWPFAFRTGPDFVVTGPAVGGRYSGGACGGALTVDEVASYLDSTPDTVVYRPTAAEQDLRQPSEHVGLLVIGSAVIVLALLALLALAVRRVRRQFEEVENT